VIRDRQNPLPEWGKCWRDFERDGDWNDAFILLVTASSKRSRKCTSDGGQLAWLRAAELRIQNDAPFAAATDEE